jgi:Mn2+/Fe2+ NRAMP family transporter
MTRLIPEQPTQADLGIDMQLRLEDRLRIARLRQRKGLLGRLLLLVSLIGPGILVMIADNDAGGVITYAQTGAAQGLGFFLPFLLLLAPVAYIVQEMTVRLGAVTHRGHAEMIWRRYGPFWGWFSLIDLVLANALTLVTEFIGIRLGLAAFGVPAVPAVLAGALVSLGVLLFLRYRTWERVALWIAAFNLIFVPLTLFAHPDWAAVARAFGQWTIPGGFSTAFLYLVLANLGTTIAPWMLFFQQSSVVDKGLTPKDIRHGQLDTLLGTLAMTAVALSIVILTGSLIHGMPQAAHFGISQILSALGHKIGRLGESLFALGLVEAGLIASIAINASSCWAVGEAFDLPRSINVPLGRSSWGFYLPALLSVALAATIVLLPGTPLGFLNLTVQVIATIFMPSAMLFLLFLLNDREIMGEHVNRPWQNWASGIILSFLVLANALYGLSVIFPHLL